MTAPDLDFHSPQRRAQSTTQAEREAAARIVAACADKPVRRVTTEYLRTLKGHAESYAKIPWSQKRRPHSKRGGESVADLWAEPVGVES